MTEGRLIRRFQSFERGFTQLPNSWIRDRQVSLKARGLLGMLMSFEPGFTVTIAQLASDGHGGKDLIRGAVEELEQAGYLVRRPRHKGGRYTADDWELTDPSGLSEPSLFGLGESYPQPRRARVGKSAMGRTASENPPRTASENPTSEEHLKNTLKELPEATPVRARGDEELCAGGCGQPWRFQPSQSYGICARCVTEPGWHLAPAEVTR